MKYLIAVCAGLLYGLASPAIVEASSITCGGANRSLTLADATLCTQGTSANPDAALISSQGGLWTGLWALEGELTSAGTDDLLTVTPLAGTFGGGDVNGAWTIAPEFWQTWGRGVISAHVGQGGGGPDWWLFLLEPGDISGTWSYLINSGTGGGLSNLKLWGSGIPGTPFNVQSAPEPASLLLLGTGLTGLAIAIRRRRTRTTTT